MIHFSRRTALLFDSILLLLLGGAALALLNTKQLDTGPWEWASLGKAFFFIAAENNAITPGPLGTGLINTLRLSFWTMILGGIVGICLGLARSTSKALLHIPATVWVAFTRNLPPLVLIFIVHYFLVGLLTAAIDWNFLSNLPLYTWFFPEISQMPVFFSAVMALSLYQGAYIGEIIKAGICSIPQTQWEAAVSLGFSRFDCLRLIILPQAFRMMLPPLTNQAASLIKDTAIVSVISVPELTFQATEYMASSGLVGEVWLGATACYLIICLCFSLIGGTLEKRTK